MYNRYIPQPDGSFRRCRVPDRHRPVPAEKPKPEPPICPPEQESCPPPCSPKQEPCPPPCQPKQESCPPKKESCPPPSSPRQEPRSRQQDSKGSIGGFFRQLLPKDLDTGDLLIILLLLLMAGDCQEDQNTALLTLALYLFM